MAQQLAKEQWPVFVGSLTSTALLENRTLATWQEVF
jgi:hypothetical protein